MGERDEEIEFGGCPGDSGAIGICWRASTGTAVRPDPETRERAPDAGKTRHQQRQEEEDRQAEVEVTEAKATAYSGRLFLSAALSGTVPATDQSGQLADDWEDRLRLP
jgi:hypothetical protein